MRAVKVKNKSDLIQYAMGYIAGLSEMYRSGDIPDWTFRDMLHAFLLRFFSAAEELLEEGETKI